MQASKEFIEIVSVGSKHHFYPAAQPAPAGSGYPYPAAAAAAADEAALEETVGPAGSGLYSLPPVSLGNSELKYQQTHSLLGFVVAPSADSSLCDDSSMKGAAVAQTLQIYRGGRGVGGEGTAAEPGKLGRRPCSLPATFGQHQQYSVLFSDGGTSQSSLNNTAIASIGIGRASGSSGGIGGWRTMVFSRRASQLSLALSRQGSDRSSMPNPSQDGNAHQSSDATAVERSAHSYNIGGRGGGGGGAGSSSSGVAPGGRVPYRRQLAMSSGANAAAKKWSGSGSAPKPKADELHAQHDRTLMASLVDGIMLPAFAIAASGALMASQADGMHPATHAPTAALAVGYGMQASAAIACLERVCSDSDGWPTAGSAPLRPGRSFFRKSGARADSSSSSSSSEDEPPRSAGHDPLTRRERTQVLEILGGGRPVTMGEVMEEMRVAYDGGGSRQRSGDSNGRDFSMTGRVDGFMDAISGECLMADQSWQGGSCYMHASPSPTGGAWHL